MWPCLGTSAYRFASAGRGKAGEEVFFALFFSPLKELSVQFFSGVFLGVGGGVGRVFLGVVVSVVFVSPKSSKGLHNCLYS